MAVIDDDVSILQLIAVLWKAKWVIAATGMLAGLASVGVTLGMPNVYRSEAVLAPAADSTQSTSRSLAAQVSSLAGLSIGGLSADSTQVTLATLKSRSFLVSFIRRHKFEVPLIAGVGWDDDQLVWKIDPRLYDVRGAKWVREPDSPRGGDPSDEEIYSALKESIEVGFDRATGLISVSLSLYSPVAARDWLSMMIVDLNFEMRRRAIDEASSSINYLEKQIQATEVASMRETLYRLVEDQLRDRTLAEVRESFAVTVIDPPALPEEKVSPIRSLICLAVSLLGALVAALVVLTVNAVRSGRSAGISA